MQGGLVVWNLVKFGFDFSMSAFERLYSGLFNSRDTEWNWLTNMECSRKWSIDIPILIEELRPVHLIFYPFLWWATYKRKIRNKRLPSISLVSKLLETWRFLGRETAVLTLKRSLSLEIVWRDIRSYLFGMGQLKGSTFLWIAVELTAIWFFLF